MLIKIENNNTPVQMIAPAYDENNKLIWSRSPAIIYLNMIFYTIKTS